MVHLVLVLLRSVRSAVGSRADLALENLALRQQLAAFTSASRRPRITAADRWFWITLRRLWSCWLEGVVLGKPEIVVRWHRAGFRRYWAWLSRRRRAGRPAIGPHVAALIRRMATENSDWGAPRIDGELQMLGLNVSERTISRYMPRRSPCPDAIRRWLVVLRNHREAITAMDLFVVPTVTSAC